MLIGLLIALLSDCGKEIIQIEREMNLDQITDQIHFIEIILGMEEWLKHGNPTKEQVEFLPDVINDFIDKVNLNGQREGMSTKLIKNHLYFHMSDYIDMGGPPKGWDAASNESHNKIVVKAPAKNTQKRPPSINLQTTERNYENETIKDALQQWNLQISPQNEKKQISNISLLGGATFIIRQNYDSRSGIMNWSERRNRNKPLHPQTILDFCIENVLPISSKDVLHRYTEYKCQTRDMNGVYQNSIFRAHPCFHNDSGQVSGVWYDWALVNIDGEKIPCQIMLFLKINQLKYAIHSFENNNNNNYAVVCQFEEEPKKINDNYSFLVRYGTLRNELNLISCSQIENVCAVVPNVACKTKSSQVAINAIGEHKWFVVSNCLFWLQYFTQEYILEKEINFF